MEGTKRQEEKEISEERRRSGRVRQ